jgi:F-type H+-transporting ATPase subunit a
MLTQIIDYLTGLPHYFIISLIVMSGIALFSILMGRKISHLDIKAKPSKLVTAVMLAVGGFNGFVKNYVGKHWDHVAPFALTMAIYVFISNITGLVAVDSPTQFSAITFSMSLTAFFVVQSTGLISQRWRHFLGVFQPLAPMAPLNIVSEFVPIVSMALRLFGNIASGALLLGLLYRLLGWLSIVVTPAFHLVFDIGFGLIQTLVIVLLTIIFASMKVSEADFEK